MDKIFDVLLDFPQNISEMFAAMCQGFCPGAITRHIQAFKALKIQKDPVKPKGIKV